MAKAPFLPKDDNGKADTLDNFASKIATYATTLEISAADVSSVQADAAWFRYVLGAQKQMQNSAQQWTAYKNLMRDGGTGDATPPAAPVLPTPAPAAAPAGIIPRFASLVARSKRHKNFTDAIGADLGVIGPDQTIDPTTFKPVLDIRMEAGHPTVVWTKGDADALEIWVDRGDGKGFAFLAIDSQPNYPRHHRPPGRWFKRTLEIQSYLPAGRRAGGPMERRDQHDRRRVRATIPNTP